MMLHGSQPPQSPSTTAHSTTTTAPPTPATAHHDGLVDAGHDGQGQVQHAGRKRKADSQDNERLSKRLSLLNLEKNGSKLYVPVENPNAEPKPLDGMPPATTAAQSSAPAQPQTLDDSMQLDDSKYKVYIYNIDDELTSSDNDSDAADEGKLVFLPDIEKHLKANRIPPRVFANSEGELAGMQMVLYNDPKSLSVPESKDSVRKAIIESRNRLREKQQHPPISGDTKTETITDAPLPSNGFQNVPADAPPASEDMEMDVDMD